MPSAYLLVTHGSHDRRPHVAIADLVDQVRQRLSTTVGTAVLECSPLKLHEQIQQFSQTLEQATEVQIVPLFLLAGVHVMEDLPEQVAIAQQQVQSKLTLMPYLGSDAGLWKLLSRHLAKIPSPKILLSHGSRRSSGNLAIETLADQLNALPAFWTVAPSLGDRIAELNQTGCQEIAIFPYFLFPGGITDAISAQVDQLAEQYPHLNLQLLSPLEVSEDLVDVIVEFLSVHNLPNPVMPIR